MAPLVPAGEPGQVVLPCTSWSGSQFLYFESTACVTESDGLPGSICISQSLLSAIPESLTALMKLEAQSQVHSSEVACWASGPSRGPSDGIDDVLSCVPVLVLSP